MGEQYGKNMDNQKWNKGEERKAEKTKNGLCA